MTCAHPRVVWRPVADGAVLAMRPRCEVCGEEPPARVNWLEAVGIAEGSPMPPIERQRTRS